MAKIAKPRKEGSAVTVKDRKITFSYWPMYRSSRRYGLHSHVYATNPWSLIHTSVTKNCPAMARPEALASLEQAEFFYRSAVSSREWAAKPLPLYYSFMNLAKAFSLSRGIRQTFDRAQHGLTEQLAAGGKELVDAYVEAFPSPGSKGPNIFADFLAAMSVTPLTTATKYPLINLLPQTVPGHRLWCDATNADERFFAIEKIPFLHRKAPNHLWSEIHVLRDDLGRVGKAHNSLLNETRLTSYAREVKGNPDCTDGADVIRFEQKVPISYSGRTADKIAELVHTLRPYVWSVATTNRPFRRYYLYACPTTEHTTVLPQLLSVYAITYYLGSITRYRPQHFSKILAGPYGEFFQEFLSSQPSQFIYLIASDFGKRDIARAPLA